MRHRYHNSINGIKQFYNSVYKAVDARLDLRTANELVISSMF